jgi:hypothetical protein
MQFHDLEIDKILLPIFKFISLHEPMDEFLFEFHEMFQRYNSMEGQRNIIVEGVLYKIITYIIEVIDCIEQYGLEIAGITSMLGFSQNQSQKRKNGGRNRIDPSSKSVLMEWLESNISNPYPTNEEKDILVEKSKLTCTQVENWLINARRRYIKKK